MKSKRKKLSLFLLAFFIAAIVPSTVKGKEAVTRLFGDNRYLTAVEGSKNEFTEAQSVVLVTGENFPDALCATPLAKKNNGPILLARKDKLDVEVLNEIKRLKATKVFIIGGPQVISSDIEKTLRNMKLTTDRIYGSNRYETSVKIAERLGSPKEVVVATGEGFADGLSIAPYAGSKQIPILLTEKEAIPKSVATYMSGKSVNKSYIIGGTGVIGNLVMKKFPGPTRIGGDDRYETNREVLNTFSGNFSFSTIYTATGNNFPDALTSSALAAKNSAPLLLVNKNILQGTLNILNSNSSSIKEIKVFGGENVVPTSISNTLESVIPKVIPIPTGFKVCIDAGHGGTDSGAEGFTKVNGVAKYLEKNVNLSVALKVGKILEDNGVEVVYTRKDDTFISLSQRSVIANNAKVNYFVSIHCNSADIEGANGIETYYYYTSTKGKELAQAIQDELIKETGLKNRDIKDGSTLAVIKNTKAPAVLAELGFISNQNEEALLISEDYQNKCANAISRGIMKCLK